MTGVGLLARPVSGWQEWLSSLTESVDSVLLDTRGFDPGEILPDLPSGISLLIGQADQFIWRAAENSDSLDLVIALEDIETWDGFGIPCVTNIDQLIKLAHKEREISRLVMLPDDIAGLCGKSAALIMIQAALERFQGVSLSLVSNAGPELVASLVSQGVTTVYLADQFTLLSDYPLPASRKRSLARLRRNLIRRYTIKTSLGVEILQVGLIDPRDWKPKDLLDMERYAQQEHNDIIRNTDARLAPTSEGLLASKTWSVNGLSCSELLRIYKRHLNRGINGQGSQKIGIERMSTWLGTRLPVVQGPMTRVSDSPAFAKAVAEAGAMPVIAAAMLSPKKLGLILEETSKICNNQPWGVGLLAFRSDKELKPQIEEVKKYQPNLIILAGGNPAQTEQFGELSDRAFLHSPTPELFEAQLAEGCRRFILEGRECGGHTGPCSSFALWEGCLQVLSQQPKNVQEETYILFAGGIHSKKASKLILELLSRSGLDGLIHGYLVGTLTLFSIEAVSTGAISPVYQNVLIDTTDTVLLETAPGHQSRCAITPFAAEFLKRRTQGLSEGVNGRELANILDSLILGRLRLASKGLRREGDQLLEVTKEEQINEGMFMVGETAALQNEVMPLEYLLEEILIGEDRSEDSQKSITNRFIEEPIAITGMAVALPGATTLASYWSMIIRSEKQIKIVPSSRWPADRYYSSESTATSVVSKWGTFIEPIVIDLAPYPITPAQAAVTEPTQIIALDLVTKALSYAQDISLSSDEREKTGVIFAASGGVGELGQSYTVQTAVASDPQHFEQWLTNLPKWTNSSFPGLLSNVTAGRVSNAFDFLGPNLLVDAACASSLAAVDVAISKLRSRECDKVIVGSVDNLQGPFPYFCFSQSGALSRKGESQPFCVESDGIVIGEGCAVIILERLETASRSGVEIYGVIDAIGSSSDGRGKSLTAPSHKGQMLSFRRAFETSDRHPSELEYYEAHGTGTPVGDRSELAALVGFLNSFGVNRRNCAVGSVKSLVGHTKATAGLAGLIKAVMSLHHGVIPGQSGIKEPHPELCNDTPVYLPSFPSIWPCRRGNRLAAVSAFGFGGTNFTALVSDRHRRGLQEYAKDYVLPSLSSPFSIVALPLNESDPNASVAEHRRNISDWLELLAGVDKTVNEKIIDCPLLPQYTPSWQKTALIGVNRLSNDGLEQINKLEAHLRGDAASKFIYVSDFTTSRKEKPALIVLFPGQGSVYPGMGATFMLASPRARKALDFVCELHPDPSLVRRALGGSRDDADRKAFWTPPVLHVVLMLYQLSAFDLLDSVGLKPDGVIGHSIGDYLALHASGALRLRELVQIVISRAMCIQRYIDKRSPGDLHGMLVVKEDLDKCEGRLNRFHDLAMANRNAPRQGVVAGPTESLLALQSMLDSEGVESMKLDLPVAYHHTCMREPGSEFANLLSDIPIGSIPEDCTIRMSTNPNKKIHCADDIRGELAAHLCSQVDFVSVVRVVETQHPGAIYVDLGPRQTGARLLQANGISEERTLRIDDKKDPSYQALSLIFELLNRGLRMDEAALMKLASPSRTGSWYGDKGRHLPYLVNGHAAVPLNGRPLPTSPLAAVACPTLDTAQPPSMDKQGTDPLLEVYAEYQRTMRKFLESQDRVFSSLAGSPSQLQPLLIDSAEIQQTETETEPLPPNPQPLDLAETKISQRQPSLQESSDQASMPEIRLDPTSAVLKPQSNGDVRFKNEQDVQDLVTKIIVERTGYPEELLELDAHLESDLGIDSIKQVEILGALIESMPNAPSPELMQEVRSTAREKQSIKDLSSFIFALNAGKA